MLAPMTYTSDELRTAMALIWRSGEKRSEYDVQIFPSQWTIAGELSHQPPIAHRSSVAAPAIAPSPNPPWWGFSHVTTRPSWWLVQVAPSQCQAPLDPATQTSFSESSKTDARLDLRFHSIKPLSSRWRTRPP